MKPLQGDSVQNNSCSCTSCDSKSASDRQTFKRLLVQGSRINRLLTSKYHMHLRQSHLLDKLIKTRALYDALRNQLLSSSESSASDLRPRQSSREMRKAFLEAKKSSDISALVDLVDKGTGLRKLSECCSCCRCSSKLKLIENVQKSRRNRPVHAGGNIPSRSSVGYKQETSEAKNIKSDPCTCACYEHEKNKISKEMIDKTRPGTQITERDKLSTAPDDHKYVSLNHGMLRTSHHKLRQGKAYPSTHMEYIGEGSNRIKRKSKLTHENVIKKTESKEMLKVAQKYIKDSLKAGRIISQKKGPEMSNMIDTENVGVVGFQIKPKLIHGNAVKKTESKEMLKLAQEHIKSSLKAGRIISQKKEPESRPMVGKTSEESMIYDNKTATKFIERDGGKRKVQNSELKQRLAHRTRKTNQGRKENTNKSDTSRSSSTSIPKETSFKRGDKRQKRVEILNPKEYILEEPNQQKKTKNKILPQKDPADEVNQLSFNFTPTKNYSHSLKRCLCSLKLKINDTKSKITKNVTNENLNIKDKQNILLKNLLPTLKTYDCDYDLIEITQSKVKVLCKFGDETKRPPDKKSHKKNSATSTRAKHDLRRCFCTLQLGKQENKKYNKRNEMKVTIRPNIKVQSSQNKFKLPKHDVPCECDSYSQQEEGRKWKKKNRSSFRKSRSNNISILTSQSMLLSGIKDITSILISHRSETLIPMLQKTLSSDISPHRVSKRSSCLCFPMDIDNHMKRDTSIRSTEGLNLENDILLNGLLLGHINKRCNFKLLKKRKYGKKSSVILNTDTKSNIIIDNMNPNHRRRSNSIETKYTNQLRSYKPKHLKPFRLEKNKTLGIVIKKAKMKSKSSDTRTLRSTSNVLYVKSDFQQRNTSLLTNMRKYPELYHVPQRAKKIDKLLKRRVNLGSTFSFNIEFSKSMSHGNNLYQNRPNTNDHFSEQEGNFQTKRYSSNETTQLGANRVSPQKYRKSSKSLAPFRTKELTQVYAVNTVAIAENKMEAPEILEVDHDFQCIDSLCRINCSRNSHTKQWQYYKENPTCGFSISMIAFKAKHKLQISSKDQSLLHFASTELMRFESAFICNIDNIGNQTEKQILKIAQSNYTLAHRQCTVENSESENDQYIRNPDQLTGVQPLLRRSYCTMNIHVSRQKRKLLDYECEPGICIPGECDPYECQELIMQRLGRKVSKMSGDDNRSRSSSSVKKLQTDRSRERKYRTRGHGPKRIPRSRPHRPQGLKYQTLPRASVAPANRQVARVGSKFSFDIEFSKGNSKSAPTTDSVRVPKRQTSSRSSAIYPSRGMDRGTKYRRRINTGTPSMMRQMRHRASSVTPMLKRCFCTLKLQKKGRHQKELESQSIEQGSLGTSTPPEFRDEIPVLRTTERGQNTNRKRRLLPYECEPGICIPGECDPYECLELIKRRNRHTKDFGTDSMASSTSSASMTYDQKRRGKGIQSRRFRAKHFKSKTTSVRPVHQSIPSRQAVKISSNLSFNIEFYKDQTSPSHDTDTRPSEVYEQKPVRTVQRGVYANRMMRRNTYSQDGTSTCDDDSQIGIYHRGQSTMTTDYPHRQLSVDASTQGKPYRFPKLKRCFCTLKLMSPYQRRLIEDGNVGHERSSVLYRRIGGTQTRGGEPDYEVSDQTQTRELRKKLLRHRKTGMRRPQTRSTSSYFSSRNPSRMSQTTYARPRRRRRQRDYAPRESVIEEKVGSYESPQRQAVKISSNFSFNIEFSKDSGSNLNVQAAAPIVKKYQPSYRRTRNRGLRGRRFPTFSRDSQIEPTPRRDIGLGPILRRCFCTLQLQKKSKRKNDMKKDAEAETRGKSKAKTKDKTEDVAEAETKAASKVKHKGVSKSKAMSKVGFKAGSKVDNKAEETEPQYQKTTNKRHKCLCDKRKSNICTCPPPVAEVAPPKTITLSKKSMGPKVAAKKSEGSIAAKKSGGSSIIAARKPKGRIMKPKKSVGRFRPARQHRRAFTHKLEPYECEPEICVPGECYPYECLKRIKRRLMDSSETSTDRRETKNKKKGGSKTVSKVMSKVGSQVGSKAGSKSGSKAGSKVVSKAGSKVDNKIEEAEPQYQKTTNKRHKCLCDKQKSNICTCPPPVEEVTPPKTITSSKKSMGPKVASKKSKEIIKSSKKSEGSISAKKSVGRFRPARQHRRAFTHKLEPYECEPGICVPGECDPHECLKRIKRRLMNSSGTSTVRRETRSTANMARYGRGYRDSDSQSDMQRRKPMRTRETFTRYKERKPYREKRHNRERRTYREVRPQTRSVEYRSTEKSNKQAAKIGSNVNIGIEFAIDKSGGGSGATWKPLKQHAVRHVDKPKMTRNRYTEGQSTHFRRSRTQYSRDSRDEDSQAFGPSMSSIKTGSVAPFLKRCFCTLQLRCNTENQGSPFECVSDFSKTKIQKLPREKVPTSEKSRHTRKQRQFVQSRYNTENQGSPFECISDISKTEIPRSRSRKKVPNAEKKRYPRKQTQLIQLRCNTENQGNPFECLSDFSKTKKQKTPIKDKHAGTIPLRSRSISSSTPERKKIRPKKIHRRKNVTIPRCDVQYDVSPPICRSSDEKRKFRQKTKARRHRHDDQSQDDTIPTQAVRDTKLNREAARLGSNFNIKLEFFKDMSPRIPSEREAVSNIVKRDERVKLKKRSLKKLIYIKPKQMMKDSMTKSNSTKKTDTNDECPCTEFVNNGKQWLITRKTKLFFKRSSIKKEPFKVSSKKSSFKCLSKKSAESLFTCVPTHTIGTKSKNCRCYTSPKGHTCKCDTSPKGNTCKCDTSSKANTCKCDMSPKANTCKCDTSPKANTCKCDTSPKGNTCKCDTSPKGNTCKCVTSPKGNKCGCNKSFKNCKCRELCQCYMLPRPLEQETEQKTETKSGRKSRKSKEFPCFEERECQCCICNTYTLDYSDFPCKSRKKCVCCKCKINQKQAQNMVSVKGKGKGDQSFFSERRDQDKSREKCVCCKCKIDQKQAQNMVSVKGKGKGDSDMFEKQEKYPCKKGKKCKCATCKCNALALEISRFPCRKGKNCKCPTCQCNITTVKASVKMSDKKTSTKGKFDPLLQSNPLFENRCKPEECAAYQGLKKMGRKHEVSHVINTEREGVPRKPLGIGIRIKRAPRRSVSDIAAKFFPRYTHKRTKCEEKHYSPEKVENIVEEPRYSFLLGRDARQGVKITSDFSFNIEFFKEMLPPVMNKIKEKVSPGMDYESGRPRKLHKACHPQCITVGRVEEIRPLPFYKPKECLFQYQIQQSTINRDPQEIETTMSYAPGKYDKNNRHQKWCSCRKSNFGIVGPIKQGAQDIHKHPKANQSTLKKIYCYCKNLFQNQSNKQHTKVSESRTEFNKTTNKRPLIDNLKSSNSERHRNKAATADIKKSKSLKVARVSGKNDYKKKYSRFQSGDHKSTKLQNTGIQFKQNCQIKLKQTIHENIRFTTLRTDKILKFKPNDAIATDKKNDSKPVSVLFKSSKLKKSGDVDYYKLCSCCGGNKRIRNLSSAIISLDKENSKDTIPTVTPKDVVIPTKIQKLEEKTALHRKHEHACPCCTCKSECRGITCKKVADRCAEYIKCISRESKTTICPVESEKEAFAAESGYCRDSNKKKMKQEAVIRHTEIIDKKQDKLKKLPKHNSTSDSPLIAESVYDISKLELTSAKDSLRNLHSVVSVPKGISQTCKSYQCGLKCAWKKCQKAVSNGPGHLILKCLARKYVKEDKDLKDHPVTNFTLHSGKQALWRRPGSGVGWSQFMLALREKPWLNVYCKLAGLHPRCLTVLQVWKQFADVILFLLAVAVWSPCLLSIELCKALKCCFSRT